MAIIVLADAKAHLNIPTADTTHDTEIQAFIDGAVPVIEHKTGPVTGAAVIGESYDGGLSFIVLRQRPVKSVELVTEYRGTGAYPLTLISTPGGAGAYSYTVELDIGRIVRRSSGVEAAFPAGRGSVVVNYTTGLSSVPANIALAAREIVRHWYQQTQQGGRPAFPGSMAAEDVSPASAWYALPNRIKEMLEPHRRAPAIG